MKTKKPLTDNYKNYVFSENDYDEDLPEWFEMYDIFMAYIPNENGRPWILPIVYTYYDKDRHPLYVGKSQTFTNRVKQHERAKTRSEPWMKEVVYCGLIWCETLEEMDIIELLEIQKKLPRYSRDNRRDVEEYETPIYGRKAYNIETLYTEEIFPYKKLFLEDIAGGGE